MGGWMDGCVTGIISLVNGRRDGWKVVAQLCLLSCLIVDGWTDGRMDGWIVLTQWTDGWMDGWIVLTHWTD